MNGILLCLSHKTNGCKLKSTCKRAIEVAYKGDTTKVFDYYANSCNGYWEETTEQGQREANFEAIRERNRDNFMG